MEREGYMSRKEHDRMFWHDGNVLHLDMGLASTGIYICQKLTSDLYLSWYLKLTSREKIIQY